MRLSVKILIGIFAGCFAFCLIFAFIIWTTWDDVCGNHIYREVYSPDKRYKAVLFERNCGAPSGYTTHISIIDASEQLENQTGNIYAYNGYPAIKVSELRWIDKTTVYIHRQIDGSEYFAVTKWGKSNPITIQYDKDNK